MSKIEVDAVEPQSGTDLTIGASGDTITVPAGATFDSSAATNTLPSTVVTTTGTQTLTNKTINASQLIDDSVTTAKLAYNPNPFRNIIINGDMSIAQRSTSETGVSTTGYYTVDRFKLTNASSGTWTQSQSTDVPTSQGFATSLKMDCTTADASPSASDVLILQQLIEGQNLQYLKKGTANAESLTLSFWVKSNKTGTYICELRDIDNNRTISQSYTISSASTWEKKTLTFAGDTSGALDNNNAESLRCSFFLNAGSDYTSGTLQTSWGSLTGTDRAVGQVNIADSTSNDFYVTGVQLEAGTSASDFEFLPYDVNLQRCQRYFQKIESSADWQVFASKNDSTTEVYATLSLPTSLRASPTLNNPNFNYFDSSSSQSNSGGSTTVRKVSNNNSLLTLIKSGFTSITGNRVSIISPTQDLTIDSEL